MRSEERRTRLSLQTSMAKILTHKIATVLSISVVMISLMSQIGAGDRGQQHPQSAGDRPGDEHGKKSRPIGGDPIQPDRGCSPGAHVEVTFGADIPQAHLDADRRSQTGEDQRGGEQPDLLQPECAADGGFEAGDRQVFDR